MRWTKRGGERHRQRVKKEGQREREREKERDSKTEMSIHNTPDPSDFQVQIRDRPACEYLVTSKKAPPS